MAAKAYMLTEDDERFAMRAGDVLLCIPYLPDPVKLTVICRISDGYDPECNVYLSQVQPMSDSGLADWAFKRQRAAS